MDKFTEKFLKRCPKSFNNRCVEWVGDNTPNGYGQISVTRDKKRTRKYVHRVSFEHFVRTLNAGELVCHRCDNPACFNPNHLFAGIPKDNTADMCAKGRWNAGPPRGERNPSAKLTEEIVRSVMKRWENGESIRSLARECGVAKTAIALIVHRKTWIHIDFTK